MDKVISLEQSLQLVQPGMMIGIGGMTVYRRPVRFITALIDQFYKTGSPSNLTLMTFTAGPESDLLVGAGMVSTVRTCYFGFEIFGLAPMFSYRANRGEIQILEETEASLALGLRARLGGVGFMPGLGWIGTDLPALRPDVKTIIDPYSGEELMAFPAIAPDVAIIHALKADPAGNTYIGGNLAVDQELAMAADVVIVTAEEIVPELNRADVVAPFITHVVHLPGGAKPTSCHPLYPVDGEAILHYVETVGDPQAFEMFVKSSYWG